MKTEVVLRDFDGTKTIYPVDSTDRQIIHTGDEDSGILITRHYIRTEEQDSEGRIIYAQSNL